MVTSRPEFIPFAILAAILMLAPPAIAAASSRVELLVGARVPRNADQVGDRGSVQPAIGVDLSLLPRGWPVGIAAYASGAAERYEGSTLDYPGFGDWLSADYRLLYGDAGLGLEKAWHLGRARLSLSGGLMASTTESRVSRDAWSETSSDRANGQWLSVEASRTVLGRLGLGIRARYTWETYSDPELDWATAGGLKLGMTVGFGFGA